MSDALLRFVPEDPRFVPAEEACARAVARIRIVLPLATAMEARRSDDIRFIDAGGNFESVACAKCQRLLANEWWVEAVARASSSRFEDLEVEVPCCGEQVSLNNLHYRMPQGFARFVIEATNPDIESLPAGLLDDLERILGTRVRVIWAHC